MAEYQQNNQSDFMIEKIKERPVNKKKLLRRTIITASMAVIFGLIACFTFLILEPVISNFLYPEEEPQIVVFPEDQEEMSPEEMLAEHMQQANQNNQVEAPLENITLEQEQIQEILAEITLDVENYKQIYSALSDYVNELNKYMVTVTGVTSNIDWFNNVQESKNQASGVLFYNNGKELLALVDYTPLENAEKLSMTFYNGFYLDAEVKGIDATTNLAVVAVSLEEMDPVFLVEGVRLATLGTSNIKNIVGIPIVALGRPMGTNNSLGYGMITSISSQSSSADTNYKILQTDIIGSQNACGVLFNMQKQVVGIITNNATGSDMKNMVTAYGISELKKRIEKMSNGQKIAYMGISGVDVTKEANEELGVPYGAYITEIDMDSPAMLAGIQQGDVLVQLADKKISNYTEYTNMLMQLQAGETVEVMVMRQAQDAYKEMKFSIVLGEVR